MDELDVGKGAILLGKALEDAAVAWVMAFERRHGRAPVDRQFSAGFPGDIESPPRLIEVKSTATSCRGWFLPLQPVQVEHARTDPAFHLYVVEHIGSGRDPSRFTLRILAGDHLRRLAEAAVPRTSYEVPWATADYDATPVEWAVDQPVEAKVGPPVGVAPPAPGPGGDVAVAIETALRGLGGEASVRDIEAAVESAHPGRWASLGTAIADHAYPGSPSSLVPPEGRILVRVGRGRYRLR